MTGLIGCELFAQRCTEAMLPFVRETCDGWWPDIFVHDSSEYALTVAAHESGIPQAQFGISLSAIEFGVRSMVAPIIDRFAPGVAAAIECAPSDRPAAAVRADVEHFLVTLIPVMRRRG